MLYTDRCRANLIVPYYGGAINSNIKLWISAYPESAGNPLSYSGCGPDWNTWPWVFHQYSVPPHPGSNPNEGADPGMDQDVFYGTQTDFDNLINGGSSTERPDLIITPNTISVDNSTVAAGSTITAYASETNQGTASAGTSKVGLWLSQTDPLNTSNATYLGDITGYSNLSVGEESTKFHNTVTIPSNTASGQYYLFFWADGGNCRTDCNTCSGDVVESNECNNFVWTYPITVTGCSKPDQPTISGPSSVCYNSSASLSVSQCSGCTYSWSPFGGNSYIAIVKPTSLTTFTETTTNACGSSTSNGYTVDVLNPPATPVITANSTTVCSGNSLTLNASNPCSDCSYAWSDGQTGSSITINPTITSTYTVTASNTCGGTKSADFLITVNPTADQPVISGTHSICSGSNATLSVQNLCSDCSYIWSDGESGSAITVYPNVTATYSVTATTSCGQTTTSTDYTVIVNPSPDQPIISGINSVCSGKPTTLSVQNVCGDCLYSWSDGSSGSSITVYPNSTTTYTITSGTSCGQTATSTGYTVRVNSSVPDQPVISGTNQINLGESTTLSISNPCLDGCTYTWSTGSTNSSIVILPNTTTDYNVTAHNTCGQTTSAAFTVIVVATQPLVNSFSPTSGAAGTIVNITGTNFTPGSKVTFGGTQAASVTFVSATHLSTLIGNGSTGYVLVETAAGSDSIPLFTYSCDSINNPTPLITSIGDTILTSTITANYYQWYFNNTQLTNEISKSLHISKVGFYRIETSPNNACWVSSFDYPIIVTPNPLTDSLKMFVYPNPTTTGTFNVDVKLPQTTGVKTYVRVYDINGNLIMQTDKLIFFGNEIRIPVILNNVVNGDYIVKVFINKDERQGTITIAK